MSRVPHTGHLRLGSGDPSWADVIEHPAGLFADRAPVARLGQFIRHRYTHGRGSGIIDSACADKPTIFGSRRSDRSFHLPS